MSGTGGGGGISEKEERERERELSKMVSIWLLHLTTHFVINSTVVHVCVHTCNSIVPQNVSFNTHFRMYF